MIKYFYSKSSVKRKILEIEDGIKELVKPICNETFSVFWYGAYEINPENLIYWICVKSDNEKFRLTENSDLTLKIKALFTKHKYPSDAIKVGFESQETVDRESNGNWYHHFK